MKYVNIHEAKTHLSRLIEESLEGADIVLCKAGKPLIRLQPYATEPIRRTPGAWKGKVWIADDFDDTPAELIDLFEGCGQ